MNRPGWARLCVLCLVTLGGACAPPAPDTVLLNGHVFTADPANPWAEALALRGDRVVAVGTTSEIAALASSASARRDLGGRAVVPGFNDAHVNDPGGDAAALAGVARAAIAHGVTSIQWFVDRRPVAAVAEALVAADTPLRLRVFRMPRTGADGQSIDSRPHLPPQPSFLVDVRGMGFALSAGEEARIHQAVGWGYGTEDLLAIEPRDDRALAIYLDAVARTGTPEVWTKKRPRLEHPGMAAVTMAQRMASIGMVVVQWPGGTVPMRSLVTDGVTLALASGGTARPFEVLAWATAPERGDEALTMEQAVTAFTRGSAAAQLADRDKGHLTVGALADLAVLSVDPFRASRDELSRARCILTVIGGRVVHDVP